jgi:hypothetical protein
MLASLPINKLHLATDMPTLTEAVAEVRRALSSPPLPLSPETACRLFSLARCRTGRSPHHHQDEGR